MSAKCDRCGVESDLDAAFFKVPRSFSRKLVTYCPECRARKQHSDEKVGIILAFAIGPLGVLFLLAGIRPDFGWLLINLAVFNLFVPVTVIPHEFGHAFAGRWAGMKIFKIYLGSDETLFNFKLAGFECEFKPVPTGGLVVAAHRTLRHLRARHFAFVFAGPAANVLMAIAVWMFSDRGGLWNMGRLEEGFAPWQMFFYANLFVLLMSLWPRDMSSILGVMPTDGKQLFQIFSLSAGKAEAYHAGGFAMEASLLHREGEHLKALEAVDEGLALYPANENLLNWRGVLALDLGNYEDAREGFLDLLTRPDLPAPARLTLLNNVAYADALLGREDLLEEADSFSREAMDSLAWVPAIRGTRGAVLVAMGRLEEGLILLRDSMAQASIPAHKAQNACLIAEAEVRMGNLSVARTYLAEARKLDAGCRLLARAESAVQGAEPNLNP